MYNTADLLGEHFCDVVVMNFKSEYSIEALKNSKKVEWYKGNQNSGTTKLRVQWTFKRFLPTLFI